MQYSFNNEYKTTLLYSSGYLLLVMLLVPVGLNIYQHQVSLLSLGLWLVAIALSCVLLINRQQRFNLGLDKHDAQPIAYLILGGLIILAWASNMPSHFHQDEFIHAYAAFLLPSADNIDWFSGYPKDYLAKFPFLWYVLQKPFFQWIDPTVWAVRISCWPYYTLILATLYALSKHLLGRPATLASGLLFIVLAPNVYLSSYGLQNISSTLFFLFAILMLFKVLSADNRQYEVLLGLTCGLAFLTNPASYITYPLIGLIMLIEAIRLQSLSPLTCLMRVSLPCLVILAPFVVHALLIENIFTQRIQQVNIVSGTWSDKTEQLAQGLSLWGVVSGQFIEAMKSLYLPAIGGTGGFSYGGQALFDPLTAILFAVSVGYLMYRFLLKKDIQAFYLFLICLIPFILGYVLTTHPPPFHRLAVLYPLFPLMLVYMGSGIVSCLIKKYQQPVVISLLTVLIVSNLWQASRMLDNEKAFYIQDTRLLGDYFNAHLKQGTVIDIAAFPSFHFQAELLFRTSNRFKFNTDSTPEILRRYDGKNPLIVLGMEEDIRNDLSRRYPQNSFVTLFAGESLSAVALFMPTLTD